MQWYSNVLARGPHLSFRNPSRATIINNLNKNFSYMIKVVSFLSNENCFVGHSRGPCGPHVARGSRFEHHWRNDINR